LLRLRKADRNVDASMVLCVVAGTATNPGILDKNAALSPFGSTGTMKMTICSNKCSGALFREPSKQCELLLALLFSFHKVAKMAQNGRTTPLTDDITLHIFLLKTQSYD
jgi:hypothetical protein